MKKLFKVFSVIGIIGLVFYSLTSYGYHKKVEGYIGGCKAMLDGQKKAEETKEE